MQGPHDHTALRDAVVLCARLWYNRPVDGVLNMGQARIAYDRWNARGRLGAAAVCERLGAFRIRTADTLYYEFSDGSLLHLGSGRRNASAVYVQEPARLG